MIGILGTFLIFDLPVCLLILIGRPPVMTLAPLLPSAVADEFGVQFTEEEVERMDGSFDSMVKCLVGKLGD